MNICDFNCEKTKEHYQFNHIKIQEDEFYDLFVNSIFGDEYLYKYLTEYDENEIISFNIKSSEIIEILIGFIINLKKEYILQNIPEELRKEYCKALKAKVDNHEIDVAQPNWEIEFQKYLDNNINGIDVIAEITLSKILEEKFGANVLISKLALSTNQNAKVFGIDTVHYSDDENALYLGESKFTKNIESGSKQHKAELLLLDYKIKEEIKLMFTKSKAIRRCNETINKFITLSQKIMTNKMNMEMLLKEGDISKIYIAFFIMHGEEYDYNLVEEKMSQLRQQYNFENFIPIYITLPIISKEKISKKIEEKIKEIRDGGNR